MFEDCFETSSGLLLVAGAPTTSKNERDMVSAIYIPPLTVPCEHSVPGSPLPSFRSIVWPSLGEAGKRDRCSRLPLGKDAQPYQQVAK